MTARTSSSFKRIDVYNSAEGQEIRQRLLQLLLDPLYSTVVSYTTNADKYPDGVMPFVEKHLLYLHEHPSVNPEHYLSNLRIKLKIRS